MSVLYGMPDKGIPTLLFIKGYHVILSKAH